MTKVDITVFMLNTAYTHFAGICRIIYIMLTKGIEIKGT